MNRKGSQSRAIVFLVHMSGSPDAIHFGSDLRFIGSIGLQGLEHLAVKILKPVFEFLKGAEGKFD